MFVRWIVGNLVREAAQKKLQSVATEAMGQGARQDVRLDVDPTTKCDIVIVAATAIEAAGLWEQLSGTVPTSQRPVEHVGKFGDRLVSIVESGVGQSAAGKAAQTLIQRRQPSWVVAAGFATGIAAGLKRGHILMVDHVIDTKERKLAIGLNVDTNSLSPGVHTGSLLSVDELIRQPSRKRELGENYEAVACDMETMAVAEACREFKVPCLAVRIVTDAVDDVLPPELAKLLDTKSLAGKLGTATGALFQRPSVAKDLWKVQEEAQKASTRLGKFLTQIIASLP